MKKYLLVLPLICMLDAAAQDSIPSNKAVINDKITGTTADINKYPDINLYPYHTSWKADLPVTLAGIGVTLAGYKLIQNKDALTEADLQNRKKDNLPFFDRGNAGYYDEHMDKNSYVPFHASFAVPVAMLLLNKNERRNASNILVMYLETMSVTGAMFTMAAGTVHRSRPLVYGTAAPLEKRLDKDNQRSLYAGHTAATAAATFFAAKVFQDLNPRSSLKPVVWTVAATVPALVGYMRYKAGMHFLSDNVIGYIAGAATGILVPQLHKRGKMKNVSIVPLMGKDYRGMNISWRLN